MATYEDYCIKRGIPFVKPATVEVVMEEDLKPAPKKTVAAKPAKKKKSNATKKKA